MKMTLVIVALLALAVTPLLADGAAIYKSKCAMCHGPDGSGQTPVGKAMKARALGSQDVQKMSDAELAKSISDGKGKMPAYKGKLTPEEIKQVIAHIRTMK